MLSAYMRPTLGIAISFFVFGVNCSDATTTGTDPDPKTGKPPAVIDPNVQVAGQVDAVVTANPNSPPDAGGHTLDWENAPLMTDVKVAVNRDSAIIVAPEVVGAYDYRVFAIPADVQIDSSSGGETVGNTTIYCAGVRQHNAPASAALEILRFLEVTGIEGPTTLVIEAIDEQCPFPGILASAHADIDVSKNQDMIAAERIPFSFYTEAEIRARYNGSLIINGHGPATVLGQPAPQISPHVLARTTIIVTPNTTATPTSQFFEGFENSDPLIFMEEFPTPTTLFADDGLRYENANWNVYSYNMEQTDVLIHNGALHMALADWAQDIFASTVAHPKQTVQLSNTNYLHVTFEVASNASARRYWWFSLCGPDSGAATDGSGKPTTLFIQTPFFYQPDGKNPTQNQWSCLQVFPRDGSPFALGPTDVDPQSDIRVMVNTPNIADPNSVVNVSPAQHAQQYGNPNLVYPGWFRQIDAAGNFTAPILDDQMLVAPRTRFDFFVRRDRVVMYVNGAQRLCNDFPSNPLTMTEGVLGFAHVIYHSSAERHEFSYSYWDKSGQRYYLQNTPYADERSWDNIGFDEDTAAPAGFDATTCYVHVP